MKSSLHVGCSGLIALLLSAALAHAAEPSEEDIANCIRAAKLQGACAAAFDVESVDIKDRAAARGGAASFGGFTDEVMATVTYRVLQRGAGTGCLLDAGWMLQPNITSISVPYHLYLREWSSGWKCQARYPGGTITWHAE